MAEVVRNNSPKVEVEEGRSWWVYFLGIIVLLVIGFFIFRGRNLLTTRNTTTSETLTPTPTAEKQVSVAIEATVEQTVTSQNTFFIKSAAGFTTLSFSPETVFVWSTGKPASSTEVKTGMTVKAEGKPNGQVFEALKITLPGGEAYGPTPTGTKGFGGKIATTPTPYTALPNTGITE